MNQSSVDVVGQYVASEVKKLGVPGMSVALWHDGKVVYGRGFGYSDLRSKTPATERTFFGFGSLSKSVTALCVLKLVSEGLLTLSTTVSEVIPEFSNTVIGQATIHDLLTHTGGVPSAGLAEDMISNVIRKKNNSGWSFHLLFDRLGDRIGHIPKGHFAYSNEGYMIIGEMIQRLTGRSFRDFAIEILAKLGAQRSEFLWSSLPRSLKATPYAFKGGRYVEVDFPDVPLMYPAGGLVSNVIDMANYAISLSDSLNVERLTGIPSALVEKVFSPLVRARLAAPFVDSWYGYGWIIKDLVRDSFVCHSGMVGVSSGFVGFLRNSNTGVSLASNSGLAPVFNIGVHALSLFDGTADGNLEPFEEMIVLFRAMQGRYIEQGGSQEFDLFVRDGWPYVRMTADPSRRVYPVVPRDDGYIVVVNGLVLQFEILSRKEILFERHLLTRVDDA